MARGRPRKVPHKKFSSYKILSTLQEADATGLKSHDVTIRQKQPKPKKRENPNRPKFKKIWYVKHEKPTKAGETPIPLEERLRDAQREVVAQEFFRLLIPTQPKTRVVIDRRTRQVHVASEGIPNHVSLESLQNQFSKGVLDNSFAGLGRICVAALWLNESDLKLGNLMLAYLNNQRVIVKIDGDWALASLVRPVVDNENNVVKEPNRYRITNECITNLPYTSNYIASNWLNDRRHGQVNLHNEFLSPAIINHPGFRREVNETLLKIMLMPRIVIDNFISSYCSNKEDAYEMTEMLVARREQIFAAVKHNISFNEYMLSPEAQQTKDAFLQYVEQFKTIGKNVLVENDFKPTLKLMMEEQFEKLHQHAETQKNSLSRIRDYCRLPLEQYEEVYNKLFKMDKTRFPNPLLVRQGNKYVSLDSSLELKYSNLDSMIRKAANDTDRWNYVDQFLRDNASKVDDVLVGELNKLLGTISRRALEMTRPAAQPQPPTTLEREAPVEPLLPPPSRGRAS